MIDNFNMKGDNIMEKILLDTDIGCDIDDAMCLTYLLNNPNCDLLGITTVTDNVYRRAMLASAICKKAGRNIPIYMGAEKPLIVPHRDAYPQQSDRLDLWEHQTAFPDLHAVEFMRKTIFENPNEITLLAIGPLTNIALLFALYPQVPAMLKGLYIMGGKFLGAPQLEWNIKYDPHAAAIVYAANIKEIYTVGLDVTMLLTMNKETAAEAFSGENLNILSVLADDWYKDISNSIIFHDPLAISILFERDICTYKKGKIEIVLDESSDIFSCTKFTEDSSGRHYIADTVDNNKFFNNFMSTLKSE